MSARGDRRPVGGAPEAPSLSSTPFPGAEALDSLRQKAGGKALAPASPPPSSSPAAPYAGARHAGATRPPPPQPARARSEAGGHPAMHAGGTAPGASTSQAAQPPPPAPPAAGRGKPVSSYQARWWRDFVWPQLGQELQMEVQLVEDKVRGLLRDTIASSARAGAAADAGPPPEASGSGAADPEEREASAAASAEALTDQVFDISFRHLLRRDPQFHTALRHSVNALDETRHDVDVATQMAFTAMVNSQTWHHKLAMISESQADLQRENDGLRLELARMKELVSDMEDEILSSEYKSTKLGKALRADVEGKSLEDRVDAIVGEMRRIKSCQTTLKRLLPSWRLYYGDETLHEFLDYEDSEKPSPSVMGALQQDVMYLASLLGVTAVRPSMHRMSILSDIDLGHLNNHAAPGGIAAAALKEQQTQ